MLAFGSIWPPLVNLGASWLLIKIFIVLAHQFGIVDTPNERSSHSEVTPRGGGIVFAGLWLVSLYFQARNDQMLDQKLAVLTTTLGGITLLGFVDDYYSLSARLRFAVQIISATLIVFSLPHLPPLPLFGQSLTMLAPAVSWCLILIGIVWSINLYNFMDGLDGLAASEALFLLGMGGLFFYLKGASSLCQLSLSAAGGVAGFLFWNWPRAQIFMGDAGSYFLGLLVASLALLGVEHAGLPLEIWLILYSAFWFDATLTLLRRVHKGRTWSQAHREHAFQRLHLSGWSHAKVLKGVLGLNSALACIALGAFYTQAYLPALSLSMALVIWVYWKIEQIYPHR